MRSWLVIALACAACRDPLEVRLEQVKAAVCGCKTLACAEDAMKELPAETARGQRAQHVARDLVECLAKLRELGDHESADPTAPAPR